MRKFWLLCSIAALLAAVGCGGSSSPGSTNGGSPTAGGNTITNSNPSSGTVASNVAPAMVDGFENTANLAYTTITVCQPGSTTNCTTINHVQIDTGSTGLRLLASAFSGGMSYSSLPVVASGSSSLADCEEFLDNTFLWGGVRYADVYMGGTNNNGELASGIPIQVVGDSNIPATPPSTCSGSENLTSTALLGANGIVGVGSYQFDCDFLPYPNNFCNTNEFLSEAPTYYGCNSSGCTVTAASTSTSPSASQQLRNPVSAFPTDNNGVIVELPAVPVGGQSAAVNGSLVFGIGTESNNGLGSAAMLSLDTNGEDASYGGFQTTFQGNTYPGTLGPMGSFLDSGSNGLFFLDAGLSGIPACTIDGSPWYCPSSTQTLSAENTGANGATHIAQFQVTSALTLFDSSNFVFSDLAGPNSATTNDVTDNGYFDWGLSFFYGRNVYTSISGVNSSGAFWAWLP